MALKKQWRRELTPPEKRMDLKQLQESWDSAEAALVDDLIPVLVQVVERLEKDLRSILDSESYSELKDLKIGYRDKLVGIFKQHAFEAYKMGKLGVFKEFDIKKDFVMPALARAQMSAKAEAMVDDLLSKIKTTAVFTVLTGVQAKKTTDQIINDVKGPTFKDQQAEKVKK